MYTTAIVIFDRDGWKLTSYGRGAAYLLECDGKSVFFQDDDASHFRSSVMDVDGWLFDHATELFGDYSEVMS